MFLRLVQRWTVLIASIAIIGLSCAVVPASAATVTDAYDQPSSLKTSAVSNHRFVITPVSNVDEGDTLVLTFPTDFDTSSIIEDDVDISDDATDLTTAASCAGSEKASITMAADVLTITICAGDGGAIAAASEVVIEIGLNASFGGTGANRITNPPALGTYFVNLSGTFGDTGSIPIPIVADDDSGVSASVPLGGGAGPTTPTTTTYSVTLSQPNGGEEMMPGDVYEILWSTGGTGTIAFINLYYSTDSGSSYTLIASNEGNDGRYEWTVPEVNTANARVKVEGTDLMSALASDSSNSDFTIGEPLEEEVYELTIIQPNGGEELAFNEGYNIQWTDSGNISYVNLYYSSDGGSTYTTVIVNLADDGDYTWMTPSVATKEAVIKVDGTDLFNVLATDTSDAVFSIAETVEEEEEEEEEPGEEDEEEPGEEEPGEEPSEPAGEPVVPGAVEPGTTPGVEPGPEEEAPAGETKRAVEASLITGGDWISIAPIGSSFDVLPELPIDVEVTISDSGDAASVSLALDGTNYVLISLGGGVYRATLNIGSVDSVMTVVADYTDGETLTEVYDLEVVRYGYVYETVNGEDRPVPGTIVIVYEFENSTRIQWDSDPYGQDNPVVVGNDGLIAWYVPNGSYTVTAGKSGYTDVEKALFITNNILSPRIELELEEEVVAPEEEEEEEEGEVVPIEVAGTLERGIADFLKTVDDIVKAVREQPEVQVAADVAFPVAIASAVGGTAILASSFNLLPFLQYLFTAPVLFFARRRRKQFGIVYNAFTKVPIDLAVVRLYASTGRLVRTMVTDKEGRYFFKADPGEYSIRVAKKGFAFPSTELKGRKTDGKLLDIYTGGVIEVIEKDVTITANIPIDSLDEPSKHTPRALILRRFFRVFQQVLALSGVILALFVVAIQPSIFTEAILAVQIVIYAATRFLVRPSKKKGWGVVSAQSGKSITNVVVRLFDPKYNKLLESTLTDGKGRYAFMVGPSQYYTTYERAGFLKKEVRPIDYTQKEELAPVSVDVTLAKQ
ncbi:MAG: carboxypeptidase-like regulatory domain-containing protein [bacterium]